MTDVYTFTYIIGERTLYGKYFVSICIDEESLYGYEEGIFIKGKLLMMNEKGTLKEVLTAISQETIYKKALNGKEKPIYRYLTLWEIWLLTRRWV